MKIRRTAVLVAIAVLVAASIAAAGAANAAAASGTLKLTKREYGTWDSSSASCSWTVTGESSVYRPGGRVDVRLYGQDTWFHDLLAGPVAVRNYDGRYFYDWYGISCSRLNEDVGDWWDEIYAHIRVYNSAGTKVEDFKTNMVLLNWLW